VSWHNKYSNLLTKSYDSFNKNIKEIVSKNIKKYRLDAGITQEQLAVDIGK